MLGCTTLRANEILSFFFINSSLSWEACAVITQTEPYGKCDDRVSLFVYNIDSHHFDIQSNHHLKFVRNATKWYNFKLVRGTHREFINDATKLNRMRHKILISDCGYLENMRLKKAFDKLKMRGNTNI